jgi:ABC-type transporter Mla subunit MlaD
MIHDVRKITTASGKQVQQTGQLIDATTANMNTVGDTIKETAGHVNKTVDAATGTLTAATDTLGEGKRTIAAAQPLLEAYTRSGEDLDALLKDRAIHETLDNVRAVTQNAEGVTFDLRQAADKATADYLRPVPWWRVPLQKGGQIIDITAAVARHTP